MNEYQYLRIVHGARKPSPVNGAKSPNNLFFFLLVYLH